MEIIMGKAKSLAELLKKASKSKALHDPYKRVGLGEKSAEEFGHELSQLRKQSAGKAAKRADSLKDAAKKEAVMQKIDEPLRIDKKLSSSVTEKVSQSLKNNKETQEILDALKKRRESK